MLRFVQGIQKAFRSNQAYAPCQKAANDQDEFEGRVAELPQRRSYSHLRSIPLSQPLHESVFGEDNAERCDGEGSSHNTESHFTGSVAPPGLVTGTLLGAGYAAFKTVHGYCSGRRGGNSNDKSNYCPVTKYQQLQRPCMVLRSLTNLASDIVPQQGYNVGPRLSVLPKSSLKRNVIRSVVESSHTESVDDRSARQNEYEKAQDEVNSLADKLYNVDKEHLAADHFLAMRAWNSKDFVAAAGLWQRTVDKFATPIAAHRLGIIYENGHGVTKDYQQASTYYQQAISHQCSRAMYRQAMLQMNGLVEGETDSMELIKQSAELGYSKAQTFLGTLNFHNGEKEKAVSYYKAAAAQDDMEACYYLGICYELGEGMPSPDDSKAAECYMKAAEGGQADAQFNLAMFYEEGCGGLDVDDDKCTYWLAKSAKHGNINAKDRLKQLGRYTLTPSVSLPAINKHLSTTLSDMTVHEHLRVHSDNSLASKQTRTITGLGNMSSVLSRASSSSSVAGTPQFYIPTDNDGDDVSSFAEWSDEGLSSASSSSLRLDDQDSKFSVDFALEKTSFDPGFHSLLQSKWGSSMSLSGSSLRRPDHEGPQITFA